MFFKPVPFCSYMFFAFLKIQGQVSLAGVNGEWKEWFSSRRLENEKKAIFYIYYYGLIIYNGGSYLQGAMNLISI